MSYHTPEEESKGSQAIRKADHVPSQPTKAGLDATYLSIVHPSPLLLVEPQLCLGIGESLRELGLLRREQERGVQKPVEAEATDATERNGTVR